MLICSSVFSAPHSSRNTTRYVLNTPAIHTITTNPVQPNAPVYAWRTHTKFDGTPGNFSQNGDLIGYTDAQGVLVVVVNNLPNDENLCGFFIDEKVAVGSPHGIKSNAINFIIVEVPFGPYDPLNPGPCQIR